ncbi:hypothetical protein [Actinomycetospora atypica]|uniref:Transcriptional regulator, AbiEi antitoxin, Type IV TA system n=1 Tax=Actinomycetospora atypica TaxID=1290095 RepID=A0ABV9YX07_9PSEU
MRDELALQALRHAQDDHLTRAQILQCGGTDEWIEAQLAGRRWVRVTRKVFRTTTGAPTPRQRERAALLCAGSAAALSHHSAARRWGLPVPESEPVHITVPYGHSSDPHPGVTLHRSRAFDRIVVDTEDMPTVSAADTCVDLAVLRDDARAAMRTVLHATLGMKVDAPRLRAVLEVRRPRRYATVLRHAARLLDEGVTSMLEALYAVDVEAAHGIPAGQRQFPVMVDGRQRFEDIRYVLPGGDLITRLDGFRWHSDRHVAVTDRARDNAAELAGRARLTFGWDEVHGRACAVASIQMTRMRQLGWEGPAEDADLCRCLRAA